MLGSLTRSGCKFMMQCELKATRVFAADKITDKTPDNIMQQNFPVCKRNGICSLCTELVMYCEEQSR